MDKARDGLQHDRTDRDLVDEMTVAESKWKIRAPASNNACGCSSKRAKSPA